MQGTYQEGPDVVVVEGGVAIHGGGGKDRVHRRTWSISARLLRLEELGGGGGGGEGLLPPLSSV